MDPIRLVTSHPLAYAEPNDADRIRRVLLARVETEGGVVGWGECISGSRAVNRSVAALVEDALGPLLVGRDPQDPGACWQAMRTHAWWYGEGGIANFAISALDMAVWDLAGKLAGLPVHRLLGGRLVDRVRACASMIWDPGDLTWTTEQVRLAASSGFTAIKCGWGRDHSASFGLDAERDVRAVEAVRDAIGPDVELSADVAAVAEWTVPHAVEMARRFEPFDLAWLEDPLDHRDHAGYARLRASTATPIATGERCWMHEDYRELAGSGTVDIVLIDPGRVEGLTGLARSAAHAEACGVGFVPHSWSSALNTAAALHVFASRPNGVVFEIKLHPSPMQHELVAQPFDQVDGWLEVPDRPGLGCDVDEDVVARYAEA